MKTQDFCFQEMKRVQDNFIDLMFEVSFSFHYLPFDHPHDNFLQFIRLIF